MPLNAITIMSLKFYLVRRQLEKDERLAGFFHAQVFIVSLCDRGASQKKFEYF
jgi:hypothetical protein